MFPPDRRGRPEEDSPVAELRALLTGLRQDAEIDCEAQPAWRDPNDVLQRIIRASELVEILAGRLRRTTEALNAKGDNVVDGIDWEGLPERFGEVVVDHMEQAKDTYTRRQAEWKKQREE